MTIQREAAYHEAAHAVLANLSKYCAIVGDIILLSNGAGELYVSISKSKCSAGGKPNDLSALKDGEVGRDFVVVLCAGLVGEQIAAERDDSLVPSPERAEPDHALVEHHLKMAGLSKKYDLHQAQAREILEKHWDAVERVATYLFSNGSATPGQVAAIIGAR